MNAAKNNHPEIDLPERWVWCRLPDVAEIIMGQSPASSTYNEQGVGLPFYQGKAEFGDLYPTPVKWCSKPKKTAEKNDVLISVRAPVGPTNICPETSCIGRGLAAIRSIPPIEFKFILYHLRNSEETLASKGTGSTFEAISRGDLEQIEVLLPPLPEQLLIVARVETLLERVRKAKEALEKVPQIMKRFRQAVLKKAFSGELTAEWRERQKLEPATELLKRIQEERKQCYEEDLKRAKAEGRRPPKKPKYLEMGPLDASALPELPEEWLWCRLGESIDINKETRNPKKEIGNEEFIYIDITGVEGGTGRIKEVKKIRGENAPSRARRVIYTNDVIMSTVRPYLKAFAIVPPQYDGQICSTGFAVLGCNNISPKYLLFALFSDLVIDQCNGMMVGTHYPALNEAHVCQIRMPLLPFPEQLEIIRRVETLFGFADEVERKLQEARKRVEKITQSILSKAFRGELTADFRQAVKNWKNVDIEERKKYLSTLLEQEQQKALQADEFPLEPADQLLERIREERAKSEQGKKDKRAKGKRARTDN